MSLIPWFGSKDSKVFVEDICEHDYGVEDEDDPDWYILLIAKEHWEED